MNINIFMCLDLALKPFILDSRPFDCRIQLIFVTLFSTFDFRFWSKYLNYNASCTDNVFESSHLKTEFVIVWFWITYPFSSRSPSVLEDVFNKWALPKLEFDIPTDDDFLSNWIHWYFISFWYRYIDVHYFDRF